MIQVENLENNLVRHYSDANKYIIQVETGIQYMDAVDVIPCAYTYEESDIEIVDDKNLMNEEITEENMEVL